MNVGIVGAEAAKFTARAERLAKELILTLLAEPDAVAVSGGCHLGGVDVWAEEAARALGRPESIVHRPAVLRWSDGFKPRNRLIARDSAVLHCIVVANYPATFTDMRFATCYHCARRARELRNVTWLGHVKSGACWTAREAEKLGKPVFWHVVSDEGVYSYAGTER